MRVGIAWDSRQLELEVTEKNLIRTTQPEATSLQDPLQSMRHVLEHPYKYPALWRALTPEDHVAILVDERVPQFSALLVTLLQHVQQAGVQPDAITILCMSPSSGQPWVEDLPDEFQDVRIEVHQPADRKKLAYLATTKLGRRIYMNRTAVDADQLVVLTRRGYDPWTGYSGAEAAIYPGLVDDATWGELATHLKQEPPSGGLWPIQEEAKEVAWLQGAPFFVQIIEGRGNTIAHIVTGTQESSREAERLLNGLWRIAVRTPADLVVASLGGDPLQHTLEDIARAFFAASRVVKPGGSIAVLTEANPSLTPSFDIFRQNEDPDAALSILLNQKPADLSAGFMWATAANHARLYLLSGIKGEVAEELYTIPIQHAHQVQNLLTEQATCLFLPDADRTLPVLA